MVKYPDEFVITLRSKPLTGFRSSTDAFGTTAPVGSSTVPLTEVEFPADWAWAGNPDPNHNDDIKAAISSVLNNASTIPPIKFGLRGKAQ
jgi:hypothetical protein